MIVLSDKGSIHYESLKPEFTEETFEEIKRSTKSRAFEDIEEKKSFGKSKKYSIYMQEKHFEIIKRNILERLGEIKRELIRNLEDFVESIRTRYICELYNNGNAKKAEYDAIMEAKITAEQNQEIIGILLKQADSIAEAQSRVNRMRGGMMKYVQRVN